MSKDYRNATHHESSTAAARAVEEEMTNHYWWLGVDGDARAKSLITAARNMELDSAERHQANLRHARMYENVELDALSGGDYAMSVTRQALYGAGIVRLNVVAAATDTLAAKIAKNKPRPSFLTSGGAWDAQQRARRLDKFTKGLFYELDIYEVAKRVFFDAAIFGTGVMHLYQDEGTKRLACERVLPDELYVDDLDGLYGKPRQMLRRKVVQREVLIAMFPEKADEIYAADAPVESVAVSRTNRTPMVEVWEAWHLPSGDKAGDGKHIIAVDGAELLCEEWKLDCFPFVALRFKDRTVGFWGKGVSETLTGIQVELNRLVFSVSEQIRRKGRGRIFVQIGSKVSADRLTNGIADIIQYTGSRPVVDSSNAVSQEEFMQIDRLYQRAFQEVGVSELSAAAKKPSGLDAAVALREFNDIESERFSLLHQAWEQFFMNATETCLKLIRHHYGAAGYKVKTPSKRYVIEMDWKDVCLDGDAYVMQIFPVSSLPQTPAARYAKVKEMMQDGFISVTVGQRLLEFPDIEAEQNLGNAAIDDVDATISAILDDAEPRLLPVEPYQNLELIVERATAAYLYARHHGADEERLDLLRQLVDQSTALMTTAQPPPPPMPGPGGPPMPGPGGPPMPGPGGPQMGDLDVNVAGGPPAPLVPPVVA